MEISTLLEEFNKVKQAISTSCGERNLYFKEDGTNFSKVILDYINWLRESRITALIARNSAKELLEKRWNLRRELAQEFGIEGLIDDTQVEAALAKVKEWKEKAWMYDDLCK